uniref:Uncharacterized protein n=1 Tax=Anguilla anguilla TaxID=7936 RepID=A0A0E9WD18_ANGAN
MFNIAYCLVSFEKLSDYDESFKLDGKSIKRKRH